MDAEPQGTTAQAFQRYSRRLLKDLESKGIIRTSVESLNLSLHAAHTDVLSAECVRTFPTVTFPATLLLRREEVETLKVSGRSVISAVRHGRGEGTRTFTEAPFDLMYGFRGRLREVDLFSPFEMIMHWSLESVIPPNEKNPTAEWIPEGKEYRKECCQRRETRPTFVAGRHYVALPGDDRILLPELPALHSLRHRWYWKRRTRPHVPVWSYAKIPRVNHSPEENARLLSIYMRPWTLNPSDVTEHTPLLDRLCPL